ncbi:hypothetical protein HK105_204853 [Polyrhizophydium stewartii]|uniref:RING-type domain-containing protein n=1 Tax=Polyrhizophydium stewartii TaxID=2732419 RepID=A0ABR4N815_9FUNG
MSDPLSTLAEANEALERERQAAEQRRRIDELAQRRADEQRRVQLEHERRLFQPEPAPAPPLQRLNSSSSSSTSRLQLLETLSDDDDDDDVGADDADGGELGRPRILRMSDMEAFEAASDSLPPASEAAIAAAAAVTPISVSSLGLHSALDEAAVPGTAGAPGTLGVRSRLPAARPNSRLKQQPASRSHRWSAPPAPPADVQPFVTLSQDKVSDLLAALDDSSDNVHDLGSSSSSIQVTDADGGGVLQRAAFRSSQRSLADIERDFKSAMVPEMDILDTPKAVLKTTVDRLAQLRQEILNMDARSQSSQLVQDAGTQLLEKIGREMLLYEQFIDMDARLALEEIMREPIEEIDEVESIMLGSDASRSSGSMLEGSRLAAKQRSVDTFRSSFSIPSLADNRRMSASSSQYFLSRSPGSNNVPSINSNDSLSRIPDDAVISVPPGPFDFVKWTKLRKLSVSLFSEAFVRQVGVPTVLTVNSGIAIGTSKSVVLLYDLAQNLLGILGDSSPAQSSLYGAATAVVMSMDHKLVFVGHARGFVVAWDAVRRVPVKVIAPITDTELQSGKRDGHVSGSAVLHLAVPSKSSFISADDRGGAFLHTLARGIMLTSVKSVRIHGRPLDDVAHRSLPTTIYALDALAPTAARHPCDLYRFIAIATPYKMAVMSMKPVPQIHFRVAWDLGDPDATGLSRRPVDIACLHWWSPILHKDGSSAGQPRLAYSSRNSLSLLTLAWSATDTDKSKRKIEFRVNGSTKLPENIVSLRWLNESTLALLTKSEKLVTVNAATLTQIESVDVSSYHLVVQPSFHKPLELFNMPVELAYGGSICVYKGRAVMLSKDQIVIASLLPWNDRIAALIRVGNFRDAFAMAVSFFRADAKFAVVGLPRDASACATRVGEHVASLVLNYVSMCLSGYDPANNEDLATYRQVADTVFDTSIAIGRLDLLFGEVYDRFVEAGLGAIFLEFLEPYVLSDRVRVITNPSVVQALITHFLRQSWLERLEQVLLHLDPSTLDIHQILLLCRQQSLYNALIYVYNTVLHDYVTPLVELLLLCDPQQEADASASPTAHAVAAVFTHTDSPQHKQSGIYVLLVYLAYTLTGLAFPIGVMQPDEAARAKSDIYSFLFSPVHIHHPGTNSDVLGVEPFPYLRLLVYADVDELIKTLGTVFEDAALTDGVPWTERSLATTGQAGHAAMMAFRHSWVSGITRQMIIDVLLSIIDSLESPHGSSDAIAALPPGRSASAIAIALYAFIARCFGKYRMHLRLSDALLGRMLSALCDSASGDAKPEREISILAIYASGSPALSLSSRLSAHERAALLDKYERAGLWRVYEHVARTFGQYGLVLRALVKDERRIHEAFQVMRDMLDSGTLTYQQSLDVKQSIMDYLEPLAELDGPATASLIADFWPSEHDNVMDMLSHTPRLVYAYLKGLVAPAQFTPEQRAVVLPSAALVIDITEQPASKPARPLSMVSTTGRKPAQQHPTQPAEYFDRFIRLMCRFDPAQVHPYLVWLGDTYEGFPYTVATVIDVVREHEITDAAAWILERTGDFAGALQVLIASLRKLADAVIDAESRAESDASPPPTAAAAASRLAVLSQLELAIGVCERASLALEDLDQRELWSMLLTEVYFQLPRSQLPTAARDILAHGEPQAGALGLSGATSPARSGSPVLSLPSSSSPMQLQLTTHGTPMRRADPGAEAENPDDLQTVGTGEFFFALARRVMNAVVAHVSLPSIIYKIVQTQQGARLADHRDLIFSMLDSHLYHRELFQAATRIIAADSYRLLASTYAAKTRGFRPARGQCEACRRLLHVRAMFEHEHDENVVVFACRHAFHRSCLETALQAQADRLGIEFYEDYGLWCPICGRRRKDLRKHLKGKGKVVLKSMPDIAGGFKDTPHQLELKFARIRQIESRAVPMIDVLRALAPAHAFSGRAGHAEDLGDVVDMNDGDVDMDRI